MTAAHSAQDTREARIRVLWLIKGLGPGGAERLLVSMAEVADHDRFAYDVAFVRPDKDVHVPDVQQFGVDAVLLGDGPRGGLHWPWRLRRLLRERRYDVVHAHSPLVAAAGRVVARTVRGGPVTVSTEHNEWPSFALPTRLANAFTASFDARRWAVSGRVRRSMWGRSGRDVEVLVHGLPPSRLQQAAPARREEVRAALGIPRDAVVSLTVANLRTEKAYPVLLDAARVVAQRDDRVVFLAVGQGPLAGELAAEHARLGLGDRFRLLGYRADVPDLMAAADVFVLSSDHEGYPVALMEAMAAGLPVVATRVGGIPDAVEDGRHGLLVPPQRPDELAAAILELAADPQRRAAMARAARARGQDFDVSLACQALESAYLDLCGAPAAAGLTR